MKTERLDKNDSARVVEILNQGGTVAFPTDTVYGLAVRYDMKEAIERMKEAKVRPESKPFPMMVFSKKQIQKVAWTDERSEKLIDAWMPGALTLIFNKREEVSDLVTNGFKTIGIRMPDDDFVLEIINRVGVPLLVSSANISGEPSCVTGDEVLAQLDGRIDAIVMGEAGGNSPSTVCDTTQEELKILRQGPIRLEALKKTVE